MLVDWSAMFVIGGNSVDDITKLKFPTNSHILDFAKFSSESTKS